MHSSVFAWDGISYIKYQVKGITDIKRVRNIVHPDLMKLPVYFCIYTQMFGYYPVYMFLPWEQLQQVGTSSPQQTGPQLFEEQVLCGFGFNLISSILEKGKYPEKRIIEDGQCTQSLDLTESDMVSLLEANSKLMWQHTKPITPMNSQ